MQHKKCLSILLAILLLLPVASQPACAATPPTSPVHPADIMVEGDEVTEFLTNQPDGTFLFDNSLPAGPYLVTIWARGYIERELNVTINAGQTTALGDILLNASAIITGRLTGPGGVPIPNGGLVLYSQPGNKVVAEALSDADGYFTFDSNVVTGTYKVATEGIRGYMSGEVTGISATQGQTTSGVNIQLARSATIQGHVRGSDSANLANVPVLIKDSSGSHLGVAITDSNGFYNYSYDLPAGTYNVSAYYVMVPGYIAQDFPDKQATVSAGGSATVDFTLDKSASISGFVKYSDNAAAEGIMVMAYSMTYGGFDMTDESGFYNISANLGVQSYFVMANYNYTGIQTVDITTPGQQVSGVNFVLAEASPGKAWIRGTITSGGSPLAGADVRANGTFYATSGADGSYEIEVELPEGQTAATYNVTASKDGYYENFRFPVNVVKGGASTGNNISLTKMPTGSLSGRVVSSLVAAKQDASLSLSYAYVGYPVLANETVNIIGTLTPARSGAATLYWSINGSAFTYSWNGTVTAGSFNRTFGFSSPGTWGFRLVWHGDDQYNPATSNDVYMTVVAPAAPPKQNATLSISVTPATVTAGSSVTISGSLAPAQSGTVTIYSSVNGSAWSQLGTAQLSAGSYTYTTALSQPGAYMFYATWSGNENYNAATSANAQAAAQAPQPAAAGDNALLIIAGVIIAVVVIAALYFLMKRKK